LEKQDTGFRFGKHRLEVLQNFGELKHLGRSYKLCLVKTNSDQTYVAWRLYNQHGKFIKQFLMEPEICGKAAVLMNFAYGEVRK
jgi:hypothetical protein